VGFEDCKLGAISGVLGLVGAEVPSYGSSISLLLRSKSAFIERLGEPDWANARVLLRRRGQYTLLSEAAKAVVAFLGLC
jgi:hypothetical protein